LSALQAAGTATSKWSAHTTETTQLTSVSARWCSSGPSPARPRSKHATTGVKRRLPSSRCETEIPKKLGVHAEKNKGLTINLSLGRKLGVLDPYTTTITGLKTHWNRVCALGKAVARASPCLNQQRLTVFSGRAQRAPGTTEAGVVQQGQLVSRPVVSTRPLCTGAGALRPEPTFGSP